MWVGLTGTPATGKTTLARHLRDQGRFVLDLSQWAREQGLVSGRDTARDADEIDPEALSEAWEEAFPPCDDVRFVEGHLSHLVPVDVVVVLRVRPSRLEERLRARGYHEDKVRENVEAEWLGVVTGDALEANPIVYEVDATNLPAEALVAEVLRIAKEGPSDREAPHVDWMATDTPSWI
ncbi:MAG TPA: AAA family ATPase [Candidatus Thermoplasmatota archaeon]|nr:AAA family ATPase [Candidatus Thermoplasmatota archaeon]